MNECSAHNTRVRPEELVRCAHLDDACVDILRDNATSFSVWRFNHYPDIYSEEWEIGLPTLELAEHVFNTYIEHMLASA